MAKIHRDGDVIIRIADIVAAHISNNDPKIVEIFTRYSVPFRFRCASEAIAEEYINELQKIIEDEEIKTS